MNPLIILDIPFGGYGIVKSMKKYHIPMFGLYHKDDKWVEIQTKLCSLFPYENDEDILSVLYGIKDKTNEDTFKLSSSFNLISSVFNACFFLGNVIVICSVLIMV